MGQRKSFGCIAGIVWALLSLVSGQTALSQTRIASVVNNNERAVVHGTTPALIAKSTDTGRMSGGQSLGRMILHLSPSAEQDQAAAKFVAALHDPSSPSYHKWLTPAQFGQLYGVSDYDAAQVQHWLQGRGLTVHEVSQSHRFIIFSGTVSQVEDAFATQMHSYTYKNTSFISNSTDIQIPAALQPVVKGVVRLHSDPHTPNAFMGGKVYFKKSPGQFSFSDGSHYLTPADFARIYNCNASRFAVGDLTQQRIQQGPDCVSHGHPWRLAAASPEGFRHWPWHHGLGHDYRKDREVFAAQGWLVGLRSRPLVCRRARLVRRNCRRRARQS